MSWRRMVYNHGKRCRVTCGVWAILATTMFFVSCDLLNQTPIIQDGGYSAKQAPRSLSAPDSVLKMLVYVFDRHTPETARQFADLLYDGYSYRYDDPTDENDLELDRASEIKVYENIFRSFETISIDFIDEKRWVEYGSNTPKPPGIADRFVSERHPDEDWTVIRLIGDMEFTNTNEEAQLVGYSVKQRFDLAFRLALTESDSTWQLASWTDRESLISARISRWNAFEELPAR
jgi:hypothetical protein